MKNIILITEDKNLVNAINTHFTSKKTVIRDYENLNSCNNFNTNLLVLDKQTSIPANINSPVINLHPALLPSFAEENALYKSFTSGIKVGGISIHYVEENNFYGRIITQYPVLIGINTHFDKFTEEIGLISRQLYPKVIESILEDRVFDFTDILKPSCKNGCSGSCTHHKN